MTHAGRNLALLIVAIGAGFAFQAWYGQSSPQALPVAAETTQNFPIAPDFTFVRLDGRSQKLSDLRGKTVLLNFWASWCAPCQEEFPQFIELAEHSADVVILAISVDHDAKAMQRFLDQQDDDLRELDNLIIAHDPKKAIAQDVFQTIRYPETILIDAKGQLRRKYIGLEVKWDSPAFIAELSTLGQ